MANRIFQICGLILLAPALSGCLSLVDIEKTPIPGGKMRYDISLIGLDFDGNSPFKLVNDSYSDEDTMGLIPLFPVFKKREAEDPVLWAAKNAMLLEFLTNVQLVPESPQAGDAGSTPKTPEQLLEEAKSQVEAYRELYEELKKTRSLR